MYRSKKANAACFTSQREALRYLVVGYWRENSDKQPWFKNNMTEREKLWGYFYNCDTSMDLNLDPLEFFNCVEKVEFYPRPGQNKMETKALCIEALIEDADKDKDVKLDFNEFTKVMNSNYQPKDKFCYLEGVNYTDGHEIDKMCNSCVCAIGNWICLPSCNVKENKIFQDDDFDNNIYADFDDEDVKSKDIAIKKQVVDKEFRFKTGMETNFEGDLSKKVLNDVENYRDDNKDLYRKKNKKYIYKLQQTLKKLQFLEKSTKEAENMIMDTLKEEKEELMPTYNSKIPEETLQKHKFDNKKYKDEVKSKQKKDSWLGLLHFKDPEIAKFAKSQVLNEI